jgi:predicted RNase H-like nuclease (RuvC/YqgF family)
VRLEVQEQQHIVEKQRFARVVDRHEHRAKRLKEQRESLRAEVEELRRGLAEIESFERSVAGHGRWSARSFVESLGTGAMRVEGVTMAAMLPTDWVRFNWIKLKWQHWW